MKVELFKEQRSIGEVTLLDGEVDPGDIADPTDRENVSAVFQKYGNKAMTYSWVQYEADEEMTELRHEPGTPGWFMDVILQVLYPMGYLVRNIEWD